MRDLDNDRGYRFRHGFNKKYLLIPFFAAGVLALVSLVVMQLWNHLVPVIFHLTTIDYWQAMGLLILSKLLFGFGRGHHRGGGAPWMRNRMMERIKDMSPEEREKFRAEMRNRCGGNWKRRAEWDKYWEERKTEDAPKPAEEK